MKKFFSFFIFFFGILLMFSAVWSAEEDIEKIQELALGLGANDLGDMAWDGKNIWVEGAGTLTKLAGEGRSINDWLSHKQKDGFGEGTITALCASGDTLITAWGYSHMYYDALTPIGDGISISIDNGETWKHVTPVDIFPDRAGYTYPGNYTTTYDICLDRGVIWCSTTFGFLIKSEDLGDSWTQVIPEEIEDKNDTERFQDPNYHGQCVDVYGDTLWVGTFQGVNVSFDSGNTWTNFSWPRDGSGDPDVDQWPGNFPVAIRHKVVGGKTHVWVASQDYYGLGRIGICHTSDNGETWEYKKYLDSDSDPWNFAFGHSGVSDPAVSDSTVFFAASSGLFVSHDLGENWQTMDIRESDNLYWDSETGLTSVMVVEDTLWVTGSDGIARTIAGMEISGSNGKKTAWGDQWEIFKGVQRVKTLDTGSRDIGVSAEYDYNNDTIKTYAFPNPFSPKRESRDYSKTRIQYALENDASVTIKIYNYSGKLIRELVSGEHRDGGRDFQEIWDGRDSDNFTVPNGVYFYKINTNKGDSALGKIMVLD